MAKTTIPVELSSTPGITDNSNATAITIDSSERVGIGTASPDSPLEIDGGSSANTVLHLTSTTANTFLKISDSNTNEGNFIGCTTDDLTFFTRNSERLRIDSTGLVGIGQTPVANDGAVLQITGNDGIQLKRSGQTNGFLLRPAASTDGLRFSQANVGDRMVIDGEGNIAIGGGSASNFGGYVTVDLRDTTGALIDFSEATAGVYARIQGIVNNQLNITNRQAYPIVFNTNDTERMRIDGSGRVMIGSTSLLQSDNMLSITGSGSGAGNSMLDIRNTSTSDTCGCIALSKGTTTTSSANRFIWFFTNNFGSNMGAIGGAGLNNVQFIASSDKRLKENIKPITGSLDKILALNPVSFDWKANGEHREAGFVAQEVEKVFPEYVSTDDDEMKTKNIGGGMTAGYVAELTKALQEANDKITALEARVKTLEG